MIAVLATLAMAVFGTQESVPSINWSMPRNVVFGEPIFIQYKISNPTDSNITIYFPNGRRKWFTMSYGGYVPIPPRRKDVREVEVEVNTQLIGPHQTAAFGDAVTFPGIADEDASIAIRVRGAIQFRPGDTPGFGLFIGGKTIETDASLPLEIKHQTHEGLAAAAERLGRHLTKPYEASLSTFDYKGVDIFNDWLAMPFADSEAAYRKHLFSGKIDGFLPMAAYLLNHRSEPGAAKLLGDLKDYVSKNRPDVKKWVDEFLRADGS